MDTKTHKRISEKQLKAIKDFREARKQADADMHSENKVWSYDHTKGVLVKEK